MRLNDVAWVPSILGSTVTVFQVGWLAGLAVLIVTFFLGDIYRAGGLSSWVNGLVPAFDKVDRAWSRHAKRRGERREEALTRTLRLAALRRRQRRK